MNFEIPNWRFQPYIGLSQLLEYFMFGLELTYLFQIIMYKKIIKRKKYFINFYQ